MLCRSPIYISRYYNNSYDRVDDTLLVEYQVSTYLSESHVTVLSFGKLLYFCTSYFFILCEVPTCPDVPFRIFALSHWKTGIETEKSPYPRNLCYTPLPYPMVMWNLPMWSLKSSCFWLKVSTTPWSFPVQNLNRTWIAEHLTMLFGPGLSDVYMK